MQRRGSSDRQPHLPQFLMGLGLLAMVSCSNTNERADPTNVVTRAERTRIPTVAADAAPKRLTGSAVGSPHENRGDFRALSASTAPCASQECNPDGAHLKHGDNSCGTCDGFHSLPSGGLDPNGAAVIQPTSANLNPSKPGFNAATKTCLNVACHGTPLGDFSYWFPGGDTRS